MPIIIPAGSVPVTPGTLDPGYYEKPFPAPSVVPPSLGPYQFWYNGFLFGAGTAFELTKIEGLDLPNVRSGDAGRARDHGSFAGVDLLAGRDMVFTGELLTSGSGWADIAAATVPGGPEAPLYFNLPGFGTLLSMCRPRRRPMPIDVQFALGHLAEVVLQLSATDPRLYSAPTLNPAVSALAPGFGFTFPLSFPLSFGGGSFAASLSVFNSGDIETRPRLIFEGPCTDPSVTLASDPDAPVLQFAVTLATGDLLVLDTFTQTAMLYPAGSSTGSRRLFALSSGSAWFTLPPGESTLQFLSGDPTAGGSLTCEYASAYIL